MSGTIRVGIGGWTFEPWRGVFYPEGLTQKRELEFASRALTSIEINGTYYSSFKPKSWQAWRDETPDGFVFTVKASRYATNRKVLAEAGPSIEKFLSQGLTELGPKLGPINWQLMGTKKFDATDMAAYFAMLPRTQDGIPLRHAIEVRHDSFNTPEFAALARKHNIAIVYADSPDYPSIDEPTADFTYARMQTTTEDCVAGLAPKQMSAIAKQARGWAKRGDVYLYFIAGAKVRNPAAATTLIKKLGSKSD